MRAAKASIARELGVDGSACVRGEAIPDCRGGNGQRDARILETRTFIIHEGVGQLGECMWSRIDDMTRNSSTSERYAEYARRRRSVSRIANHVWAAVGNADSTSEGRDAGSPTRGMFEDEESS